MALEYKRRRFTVDEYHAMAAAGVLDEDERVELLDGEIVEMSPIGPPHFSAVTRGMRVIPQRFGDRITFTSQNPVVTDPRGEPEPDLVLLRRRADDYYGALPTAADVLLLIEVSDSSLEKDRRIKLPIYARAGIPEVWIEDLVHDTIEMHRDPGPDGYRSVRVARRGERLSPLAFSDVELAVDELLPGP